MEKGKRKEDFFVEKIKDIDVSIEKCFNDLKSKNDTGNVAEYKMEDGPIKFHSRYDTISNICDVIFKLEKLRVFYVTKLNEK